MCLQTATTWSLSMTAMAWWESRRSQSEGKSRNPSISTPTCTYPIWPSSAPSPKSTSITFSAAPAVKLTLCLWSWAPAKSRWSRAWRSRPSPLSGRGAARTGSWRAADCSDSTSWHRPESPSSSWMDGSTSSTVRSPMSSKATWWCGWESLRSWRWDPVSFFLSKVLMHWILLQIL